MVSKIPCCPPPLPQLQLRPAEPAEVLQAEYVIASHDPARPTHARLLLRLLHATADGQPEFWVELPPTSAGHPEFVVLAQRFESAVGTSFDVGERCKVLMVAFAGVLLGMSMI